MRVSNYEQFGNATYQINMLQQTLANKQQQIATGKAFSRPSENPLGTNQKMLVDQTYTRIEQFQKNITDATDFLELNESTLANADSVLQSSRDIALRAANDTYDASNIATFVKELDQNIQQLVSLGNTKHLGKYIYSGEMTQTEPFTYDGTTLTYNGDSTSTKFKVSNSLETTVMDPGNKVLQGAIQALIDLKNQVATGDTTNIENGLTSFDTKRDKVIDMRSEIGTRLTTVQSLNDIYENTKITLDAKKEEIQGIDLTKTILEFQQTQQLYQGAVQATLKVMNTSILNYM